MYLTNEGRRKETLANKALQRAVTLPPVARSGAHG